MSRARNIKPGFFKNDALADCPLATRLLFIALWCEADREGRLEYRPKRIKASCLPYDDVNVEDAIAALTERGFLTIYEMTGVQYIQINNWAKHQNPHHKEIGSEIPAPPGHIDTVCSGYIPLSNTIRNRIYARDGRVCKECGATHGLSIDHIVPVSRGGNSTDDNLQVLCLGCNVRKGNKFHASVMDESCMDQESAKQVASCPTDSLIPDSLNLIPDSKHESPNGDSSASADADAPTKSDPIPYKAIIDGYNRELTNLGKARELTPKRRSLIRSAWQASPDRRSLDFWNAYWAECAADDFLNGTGPYREPHANWRPNFDYLLRADVVTRTFERAMDRLERAE